MNVELSSTPCLEPFANLELSVLDSKIPISSENSTYYSTGMCNLI